jgi:hypothetical protein
LLSSMLSSFVCFLGTSKPTFPPNQTSLLQSESIP